MCVLRGWTRRISGNLWIDWATQRNQASKIPSEQTKTKHKPLSNNISANFPLYFIAKIWVSLTGANSLQGYWPMLFCWGRVSQVRDCWRFGWRDCVCVGNCTSWCPMLSVYWTGHLQCLPLSDDNQSIETPKAFWKWNQSSCDGKVISLGQSVFTPRVQTHCAGAQKASSDQLPMLSQLMLVYLNQWSSTFLMMPPFNTILMLWWPNHKRIFVVTSKL